MIDITDTIVAVSTAYGMGGIAVIRVSGPQAISIVDSSWKGSSLKNAAYQLQLSVPTVEISIICTRQQEHLLRNYSASDSQGENKASHSVFIWPFSLLIVMNPGEGQVNFVLYVCCVCNWGVCGWFLPLFWNLLILIDLLWC